MTRAALLAAVLLSPSAHLAPLDFGFVQLGYAAHHVLRVSTRAVAVSGPGFSATRTSRGVLVVFEPYELHEEANGVLRLTTSSGVIRMALRGRGIDTIAPAVEVTTPRRARAGYPITITFGATDNDLVRWCRLEVHGRVVAQVLWPASILRWRVPAGLRGSVRISVVAVDRAGNHASATTDAIPIR